MDDALRRRLDACFDDDVTVQAEAVPELVALVERLDAENAEARCLVAACWKAFGDDCSLENMAVCEEMLSEVEWLRK